MKKKGQHFLVDSRIIGRIADYADLNIHDDVLEIGPGTGNLTEVLSARAGHVTAIEVDERLVWHLEDRFANVDVVLGDALKVELPEYNKIVANLPYQISSKVTFRLLRNPFELAVLMYQKEFAKRMVAQPGTKDYGRLTLNVWYYATCEIVEYVPRGAFQPRPKVESAIVRLRPKTRPDVDESLFLDLTRGLFGMRRKKIKRALAKMGLSSEAIAELDPILLNKRPEEVSPAEMVGLAKSVSAIEEE
jgi:16S rRNA (adenine1518-N6/adenine1519-N6)-dimethyltransferase